MRQKSGIIALPTFECDLLIYRIIIYFRSFFWCIVYKV